MRHPFRTLRGRLLISGLVTSLVLVGGVGAFLLWNQGQQGRTGVEHDAAGRAAVAQQLIERVTGPELTFAAQDLAGQTQMRNALAGAQPATAVTTLLDNHAAIQIAGVDIVVFNRLGGVVHTTQPPSAPQANAALTSLQLVATGPGGPRAQIASGFEMVGGSTPVFDVAVPVRGVDGTLLGAVLYSAPLDTQIARYGSVIGDPVIVLPHGGPAVRFDTAGRPAAAGLNPSMSDEILSATGTPASSFIAPTYRTGAGDVAASFLPLTGPDGTVTGSIGVEVPLGAVLEQTRNDQRGVILIALSAAMLMSLAILLFADRFVRRPVARLERSVTRIAAGDYESAITADTDDELGRLARSVDGMRQTIATANRHRDASDLQLREVSRALTVTTAGVDALRGAVIDAATTIGGEGAQAAMLNRQDDTLVDAGATRTEFWLSESVVASVIRGETVQLDDSDAHLLAVPMFFQERVVGALALNSPAALSGSDVLAITTLANNGAIALENTRSGEQEKEALRIFRELHGMKQDFLAIAQHELRTPVNAIQGFIELLALQWSAWDDAQRLDMVRDIGVSSRQLAAVVENIVHFSLLGTDRPQLRLTTVIVAPAIGRALRDITALHRGGLPVSMDVKCDPEIRVSADPQRFELVLRSLLDNAVKFSNPGGAVRVAVLPESGGRTVRIEIIDEGVGISDDAMPRIFDRFYQQEESLQRSHAGMGLGLSVVRRVCEEHGASVQVHSEVGKGTTFTVIWSAAPAPGQPPNGPGTESRVLRGRSQTQRP